MGEFMAFSQQLVIWDMLESHALLKVVRKAHLELQAMLLISSSISPRGLWGVHQPHLRSWISQAAP